MVMKTTTLYPMGFDLHKTLIIIILESELVEETSQIENCCPKADVGAC